MIKGQIFEMEILMVLLVLKSPDQKIIFLVSDLCLCVNVCASSGLCVYYQHDSKTNYNTIYEFVILYTGWP